MAPMPLSSFARSLNAAIFSQAHLPSPFLNSGSLALTLYKMTPPRLALLIKTSSPLGKTPTPTSLLSNRPKLNTPNFSSCFQNLLRV